jgi:VIT1/CCC1 family predicted Fe2+/Mn2+ transporter
MPAAIHPEKHFTAPMSVRDVVIGMADGLTVPFALAAGLSGAVDTTGVIVVAGLAEIAAGSIAMGLGGCAVKGRLTGIKPLIGGLQTVGIGGIAAAAAFGIAQWIG